MTGGALTSLIIRLQLEDVGFPRTVGPEGGEQNPTSHDSPTRLLRVTSDSDIGLNQHVFSRSALQNKV